MRKHFPLNSNGAEDAGQMPWKDGVPSTGVEGSYPGQALFTDTEAEILAAIDASGQARNGSDLTQLVQAIARGLYLGQFTGTANALTAVLANNVAFASLLRGVRFTGYVAVTNTAGVTVAITCLTGANAVVQAPLLTKGGNALAAGDLPVNQDFEIRWDGAVFRMVGSVASEVGSTSNATPIAQAAKSGFNTQPYQSTQRVSMATAGTNVLATAVTGLVFPKQSASSLVRVSGTFIVRTPHSPGNGYGPSYFLLTVGGVAVQQATNNGYPGVVNLTPVLAQLGTKANPLPKGNLAISLQFGRADTAAWDAIFLPNSSDESGYPPTTLFQLFIDEVEPT